MTNQFQAEPEPSEPAMIEESEGHRRDRWKQLVSSLACLLACFGALVGFNEFRNLKYRVCCKLKYFEPFKALTNRQNPSGVNFGTPMINFKVIPLKTMPVGGFPQPSISQEDAKILSSAFADIELDPLDVGRTYNAGRY